MAFITETIVPQEKGKDIMNTIPIYNRTDPVVSPRLERPVAFVNHVKNQCGTNVRLFGSCHWCAVDEQLKLALKPRGKRQLLLDKEPGGEQSRGNITVIMRRCLGQRLRHFHALAAKSFKAKQGVENSVNRNSKKLRMPRNHNV